VSADDIIGAPIKKTVNKVTVDIPVEPRSCHGKTQATTAMAGQAYIEKMPMRERSPRGRSYGVLRMAAIGERRQ
jgi:hypothetical protein